MCEVRAGRGPALLGSGDLQRLGSVGSHSCRREQAARHSLAGRANAPGPCSLHPPASVLQPLMNFWRWLGRIYLTFVSFALMHWEWSFVCTSQAAGFPWVCACVNQSSSGNVASISWETSWFPHSAAGLPSERPSRAAAPRRLFCPQNGVNIQYLKNNNEPLHSSGVHSSTSPDIYMNSAGFTR